MSGGASSVSEGEVVLRAEGLGKRYRLGQLHHDRLTSALAHGFRSLLRSGGRSSRPAAGAGAEEIWALCDVSFDVRHGEVLGIVGRNGAGKSTLLRILAGITEPTEGRAWLRGRIASLLEVGTGFHPELTGRENIFLNGALLGMTRSEIVAKLDEIVAFAEIPKFIDTPVKRYSSGMYVRLAFAVAAHLEPEILIVDEVLAVGDAAFQKKCLGKMKDVSAAGRTVLFVSHNMATVRHLCSRAILLDGGRLAMAGAADDVTETYLSAALSDAGEDGSRPAGYIYHDPRARLQNGCAVTGVQILDLQGHPLQALKTWDPVRIRLHYAADTRVRRASAELHVQTREQVRLLVCSTQPDANVPLAIEPGQHFVDCVFPRWPFAEGTYSIGAGLAVPQVHYLWWNPNIGTLQVRARDVFGTGLPPASGRYWVAVEHRWEVPDAKDPAPAEEKGTER